MKRLLSLFLTVALLTASMVFVVPATALESGATPTNSSNSESTGGAEGTPAPLPTEYWSRHMSYTFANDVHFGQAGYGTEKSPYPISTAEELAYFAWLVNRGPGYSMSGKHFALTADIDLSAYLWEPIARAYSGSNSYDYDGDGTKDTVQMVFGGVFDGGGYTIKGLNFHNGHLGEDGKLSPWYGGLALFGTIRGTATAPAKIRNLNIEGSISLTDYAYTTSNFGGPLAMVATAAYAYAEFSNINVITDIEVTSKTANVLVSGLVGYQTAGASIENCTVSGDIKVDYSAGNGLAALAGGFAARVNGTASILNSTNNANVTVITKNNTALAGGFVAKNESNTSTDANIPKFEVGQNNLLAISGCVNNGNIVIKNTSGASTFSAAGGFIGIAGLSKIGDSYVVNGVNTGSVQVDNLGTQGGVAAIVGVQRAERVTVEKCYSTTAPECLNKDEAKNRGFESSFIYTEGALRITNEKVEIRATWLIPEGCIFMPETAITTTAGAALRLNPSRDEVASILFESKFDADFLKLVEGKKLNYGTMLINAAAAEKAVVDGVLSTKDFVKNLREGDYRKIDALAKSVQKVEVDGKEQSVNTYVPHTLEAGETFYSILTNIKSDGYETEYLPIGYVSLVLDEETGLELTFYSACLIDKDVPVDPEDESKGTVKKRVVDDARIVSVGEIAKLYYELRSAEKDDQKFVNEVSDEYCEGNLAKFSPFTEAQLAIFKKYFTFTEINTDMEEIVETKPEVPEGSEEDPEAE